MRVIVCAKCCFRSQFSHGKASKKQVNQDVGNERGTTKARKNARKLNADEALNASGSWVNPKNSAGIPKKAGKRQVHVNGQSAGKWYTSPEGRKVSSHPICTNFFIKSHPHHRLNSISGMILMSISMFYGS